ncbi:glycoside hydrolase family 20 zincin-like fold domain-containing protein, partial [Paraglaciecola sp.]|nr:glycoside hydrolase family 20 zincin-like fold domain-containing protein [Paraglaciecola sp.]
MLSSCAPKKSKQLLVTQANIIPAPQQLEIGGGNFTLTKTSTLFAIPEFKTASNFLKVYLFNGAGIDLISAPQTAATIVIVKDTLLPKEGYTLTISKKRITIKASDGAGAFYATQSLRYILPPDLEQEHTSGVDTITIPCLEIKDAPM